MEKNKDDINALALVNPFLFLQKINSYKNDQQKLKQESNKIYAALKQLELGISKDFNDHMICNLKNMLEQHINVFEILELRKIVEDMINKCAAKMSEDLDEYKDDIAELNKIEAEEKTISWEEIQSKNDLLD